MVLVAPAPRNKVQAASRQPAARELPEARAIRFLSVEVPQWSAANHCFSCHNNGDAARALYVAQRLGYSVQAKTLRATTDWLIMPSQWEHNGGQGPFSDKRLARIQFAAALHTATESGLAGEQGRTALIEAAGQLAADQDSDGSWLGDSEGILGTPATYGRALATLMARNALRAADPDQFASALARADKWLRQMPLHNVMDSSVVLLASADSDDKRWEKMRQEAYAIILKGQSEDGGWGPFITAPPEPFDTALVLLALANNEKTLPSADVIRRGRKFLITIQLPDGSWPETTRPPGAESYAQRLSTTGWATLALLETGMDREKAAKGTERIKKQQRP
jgi:hypothetical protein